MRIQQCHGLNHGDFYKFIQKHRPDISPYYESLHLLKISPGDPWERALSGEQKKTLDKYGQFVVAYAQVSRVSPTMATLEWFETRVHGHGFATHLRRRLRREYGDVLPRNITPDMAPYWSKELGFDHEDVDPVQHTHLLCGSDVKHVDWSVINNISIT